MVLLPLLGLSQPAVADNSCTTYTFDIQRTPGQSGASVCEIHPSVMGSKLGGVTPASGLDGGTLKLYAVQLTTGKFYSSYTNGTYGFSFNSSGIVVSQTNKKAAVRTSFNGSNSFSVYLVDTTAVEGSTYEVKEAFVNTSTADTVYYDFRISVGTTASVTSDEPSFNHRADKIDSWIAAPYVRLNEQTPQRNNCIQAHAGDQITIGVRALNDGDVVKFMVRNPSGKSVKSYSDKDYVLTAVEPEDAGSYSVTVRVTPEGGKVTASTYSFIVDVQSEEAGTPYIWADHTPYWSYDFRDEYPDGFPTPTKVHNFTKQDGSAANVVTGEWWSSFWGDNLNSDVDENNKNAFTNMMTKFDTDFAYIRDEMGWPPDINARKGWKSFVYVFGSGLSNDNTDNTVAGGYQSSTYVDGTSWPCVWASYYPVSRFRDDADSKWSDGSYQREAMVHEGIHALFADMDGVKNAAWFHEGGNVWLQMAMNAKRDNVYGSPGWLGVGNLICPFMPIECYSGWLQDGSFGGPSAEGVNMYNSSGQQICTWRNLIGGVQYGEVFPLFLGECVGEGSVPWIWRYCKTRVLEGIANGNTSENVEGIGDEAMRSLILQYRARLATMDFGGFSSGCRSLLNSYFGTSVKAEWEPYWINVAPFTLTPYQTLEVNDAEGWLAPDTITNPGWSGGNIIPIHVTGNSATVEFRPEDDNMRAQLCYRTKDGQCFYSQPAFCGPMTLKWDSSTAPANMVVFCVVANTDYIYEGEQTRKKHFDYRIRLGEGANAVASKDIRWFLYEQTLKDTDYETAISSVQSGRNSADGIIIKSSLLRAGGTVQLDLGDINPADVTAHLVGLSGVLIDQQTVGGDGTVSLPYTLPRGLYVLSLEYGGKIQSQKMYVE